MGWILEQALFYGKKGQPENGDRYELTYANLDDPENEIRESQVFHFDDESCANYGQFQSAVRHEIKAYLDHLNATQEIEDVTEEMQPD